MTNSAHNHILIVDDEHDIRSLLSEILEDEGYRTSEAPHSESALHVLQKDLPNLIILDIWLDNSDMDGMEILAHVKQNYPEIPVLMISGHGNIEMAVKAMKLGAYEFIEKPFNSDHLLLLIQRALETNKLRSENLNLKQKVDHFEQFTATDPSSVAIKNQIEKVAPSQSRVMVSGASGSGKNLVSYMIHSLSNCASGPFVILECAVIGAEADNKQKDRIMQCFEDAKNGTLVLQNVHELSPIAQSVIVSKLQNGDNAKSVRIISTSDEEKLQLAIKSQKFKEDLYYRLNIVHVPLPSLNERKQDISELAQNFLKKYFEGKGRKAPSLSNESLMLLSRYEWPGNIRQLKNVIEHVAMLALSNNISQIEVSHLPAEIKKASGISSHVANDGELDTAETQDILLTWMGMPMKDARNHFEKYYLDFQLERFSGQISKVAHFIEMDRTALHRKLKSLEELDVNETNEPTQKTASGKN